MKLHEQIDLVREQLFQFKEVNDCEYNQWVGDNREVAKAMKALDDIEDRFRKLVGKSQCLE